MGTQRRLGPPARLRGGERLADKADTHKSRLRLVAGRRHNAHQPGAVLANEHQQIREGAQRIVAAEVPPEEEVGRGRTFMAIYATALGLAALTFVGLAILVRLEGVTQLD